MATELAKAYVQIVPSAQGIAGSISDVLSGESSSAGKQAGENVAGSLGKKLKSTLVGLGIGKMLMDSVGNASEFETSMAKVSTLFSGDSEQFAKLQSDILNMSSAYGLGATTLAEAAYSAESAGVPMEQLTSMLSGSAKLALAGFTDVDTALSATAKTMNAYGDAAGSIEDIQKVLIQTQNLGITTVGELGASLANVTPTAAAMGVSFDQVGAALAQMTASGVPTAQATTQLRSAMTELGKAGTKADTAFREAAKGTKYAGMGFKEAMNAGANLGDVFGLMQSYADATGVSMVDLWGSVEAGNAAMLIAGDVDKFNSNLEQMSTNSDVVGEAYGKMANTFGTSMNRLKESAKNFMTALFTGGDISTSFDQLLSSLGDVGGKLKDWLTTGLTTLGQNLPQMMSSLLDFAGSILGALGEVDWITVGTTLINGIVGALGELGTRLAELISGAVTSIANGEVDFASIGNAILSGVTSVLSATGEWLKTIFETAKTAAAGIDFGEIGSRILEGVTSFLDSAGSFLGEIFENGRNAAAEQEWPSLGDAIKTGVNVALNGGAFLSEAFNAGAELIKAINWTEVGEHAESLIVNGLDGAATLVSTISSAADQLISGIGWESIGQGITNLINTGLDGAATLVGTISSAADQLISGIQWTSIGENISGLLETGLKGAGQVLEDAFDAAHGVIKGIKWDEVGAAISNGVTGTIDAAGEFLAGGFRAAKDLIMGIPWGEVGATISSGLGDVWSGLTGFVGGLLGGIGDAAAGIGEGIGEAASGLGKAVGKLFSGDDARQAAEDLKIVMDEMERALTEGKEKIETAAKNIGTCIRTSIEDELTTEKLNTIGSNAMSDILAGCTITESNLDEGVASIASTAAGQFESGGGWVGAGMNMVAGIVSGVNSAAGSLMGAMRSLAMRALAAARSALGIHSPSAVMRDQVGRWIPEGIADGISRNSDMVGDAMREMSADLAGGDIADVAISQGRGLNGIPGQARGNENGNGDIISAIQGLRNDMRNLRLVVGEKVFGRAVVEYGGNRLNNYIGQAEGSEAAGYGA